MHPNQSPPRQARGGYRHSTEERVGVYVLKQPLGFGAFAEVWSALDISMNREVALKIFFDDIMVQPDLAKGVLREAETQARIDDERVIAIFSCHLDRTAGCGPFYIAMRLMSGGTLDDLLERQTRLPVARAVAIMKDVVAGLKAAHQADIVHRDIKPSNVLFDSKGRVALADFGIAKDLRAKGRGQSVFGKPGIGTPHYMCPEQHMGSGVTKAWDIYSAGVLLYEMLVGEAPFTGPSDTAIYRAKVERPVPSLRAAIPDIPQRLQLVVERCLDPDTNFRYPDCDALLRALDWALEEMVKRPEMPEPKPHIGGWKHGDRIGNYLLETFLSRGRLADIWRGNEVGDRRTVAVKIFWGASDHHSSVAQEAFLSALRKQTNIASDRIVPVYSFDLPSKGSAPRYVAMKLMAGSLHDRLQRESQLTFADATAAFRDVIDGLRAAHAAGLIHGNLTPRNILFDSDGRAAISDFGITGKLATERLARADEDYYLSPEHLLGKPLTTSSDVYSAGLILYEMLQGRSPLELRAAKLGARPPVSELNVPGVPDRLSKVILCCLDPSLEDRYADCDALARAFDWAMGPPPRVKPAPPPVPPPPVPTVTPPPLPSPASAKGNSKGNSKGKLVAFSLLFVIAVIVVMIIAGEAGR